MIEFIILGPILAILVTADILLHIHLDYQKIKSQTSSEIVEIQEEIPRYATITATITTILLFILVFIISFSWIIDLEYSSLTFFGFFWVQPDSIVILGYLILCIGIILHGLSRYTRQKMATSWEMTVNHKLVDSGPYKLIRHPSYTSYSLCFLGLFIIMPSILTMILLLGIPGYYFVAKTEEELLIKQFGEEYIEYRERTGMFLPKISFERFRMSPQP